MQRIEEVNLTSRWASSGTFNEQIPNATHTHITGPAPYPEYADGSRGASSRLGRLGMLRLNILPVHVLLFLLLAQYATRLLDLAYLVIEGKDSLAALPSRNLAVKDFVNLIRDGLEPGSKSRIEQFDGIFNGPLPRIGAQSQGMPGRHGRSWPCRTCQRSYTSSTGCW